MKYHVFDTEAEAAAAAQAIFAAQLRERAANNNGVLDDWHNGRAPAPIAPLPDAELTGDRFPLYAVNAATGQMEIERGHTTAYTAPQQIADGRWVIQSPDGSGEEAQPKWWVAAEGGAGEEPEAFPQ